MTHQATALVLENVEIQRTLREVSIDRNRQMYIDAIGVPRGVPDEFKARKIAAGFESLLIFVSVNKNVDLYYNQQRFVNYSRDALQGLAEQLGPTAKMTLQNRLAVDMLLAKEGGMCGMFSDECCTYIPDNTSPNGKVTAAIKKITDLSGRK
ncbi:ENV polyprotein (coat polyprotein) [Pristimantis euphronides]